MHSLNLDACLDGCMHSFIVGPLLTGNSFMIIYLYSKGATFEHELGFKYVHSVLEGAFPFA